MKLTLETKLQYGEWLLYLPPTTQVGSSRPLGRIHYHAAKTSANPPTPISGTKVNTSEEAFEEFVHSSDEASNAIVANMVSDLPDPLDGLLNEEDISRPLDILAHTPLKVVKPDGETIIEDSTAPRGTKRRSPMMAAPKAKKTQNVNSSANIKAGMSSGKNSLAEVDNQPRRGT
ncbi:hypothetical protein V6N13_047021 [Hibiscus sabdariffa]